MPRAARRHRWTEAACYHVLNRGHARETLFHDDSDRWRMLCDETMKKRGSATLHGNLAEPH